MASKEAICGILLQISFENGRIYAKDDPEQKLSG
jgi:hypothetical protein